MSYITDLKVSLNPEQEDKYRKDGYFSVPSDLNKGTGKNKVYLWYQRSSDKSEAITRIQFTFTSKMRVSLDSENYMKINKDLNDGAPGEPLNLYYFKGSTMYDFPIVDLHVTTQADDEPDMFRLGWKRLVFELNRKNAKGNRMHLWVRHENQTYISDITATIDCGEDSIKFNQAYIRLDENTNRNADGPLTFIFYRLTQSPDKAITHVQLYDSGDFQKVEENLNQVPGGPPVYLWYRKMTGSPIQDLTLILNPEALKEFKRAKIPVIDQNINPQGLSEFLSYYQ